MGRRNFSSLVFGIMFLASLCFGIEVNDINSSFDSGNLSNIVKVSDNNFTAQVAPVYDTDVGNYVWYYFTVNNTANQTFKINITNIETNYRNCYYLYSYDGNTWNWSSTKLSTTTITHNPGMNNKVWIATDFPYTYTMMDSDVNVLSSLSYVTTAYHTMTSGRKVYSLKITDPCVSDSLKKKVVVMTGQHGGERRGMVVESGVLAFVDSNDPNAQILRKKCVFYFFPMMNPDGVYGGGGRFNSTSHDLNREWADSNANTEAEVLYARDIIKSVQPNYFVDFHANGIVNAFLKRADCGSAVEANSIAWANAIKANTFWSNISATTSSTAGVSTWYNASQGASAVTADFDSSVSTTGQELTWAQTKAQGTIFALNMLSYIHVAPMLDTITNKTVAEGNSLTFDVNGHDYDGLTLTYTLPVCPNGMIITGTTVSWTPDVNQAGYRIAKVQVYNGYYSTFQDVNIIVLEISEPNNNVPVLDIIGSKDVNEDANLAFDVNATDVDVNSTLTYSCTYNNGALPAHATFSNKHFHWIPDHNQIGSYNFLFKVDDGNATDTELVIITVHTVWHNNSPYLDTIDNQDVNVNELLTFTISGSDVDGNSLVYSANSLPTGASFDDSNQVFTWTPDVNQAGSYIPTFHVSDGELSDSQTVTITVYSEGIPQSVETKDKTSIYGGEKKTIYGNKGNIFKRIHKSIFGGK